MPSVACRRKSSDLSGEMIPVDDAVTIAKILGEVAGETSSLTNRRRLLMRRLRELTDADGWLWSLTYRVRATQQPISMGVIHDGLTEQQFGGWVEASQTADPPPPEDQALGTTLALGQHFTRTRDQLVPDDAWYEHPTVRQYRTGRGIDDFLYSLYPVRDTTVCSAIGLFRHVGRDKFDARHRKLVHIILASVAWMHTAGVPGIEPSRVAELTPRQRIVLAHLLGGKRRSEIARIMNIKETTVKNHTQAVLRYFEVKTQLDLVCKFNAGTGPD